MANCWSGRFGFSPIWIATTFEWTDRVYRIVPTFHPAAVFYRPSHRPDLDADWLAIGEMLKKIGDGDSEIIKRILVIGCSGAGKSTLSIELSERLQLPVVHLDALFWNEGWVPTSKQRISGRATV